MRHFVNIISVILVGTACVVACIGSYRSHNYHMSTENPYLQPDEIVELPEIVEEVVEEEIIETPVVVKSDIQVMAEAVMGEAGGEPLIGKVAVAATILNRMEYYNQTVYQALEAYNAYPYYGVVTNDCYRAVELAMENRDLFPSDMMYFRTLHYHDFGVPYVQIGNHYFSTKE